MHFFFLSRVSQDVKHGVYSYSLRNKQNMYSGEVARVKVKVKFTLEQATRAQRGSRDTALLFL